MIYSHTPSFPSPHTHTHTHYTTHFLVCLFFFQSGDSILARPFTHAPCPHLVDFFFFWNFEISRFFSSWKPKNNTLRRRFAIIDKWIKQGSFFFFSFLVLFFDFSQTDHLYHKSSVHCTAFLTYVHCTGHFDRPSTFWLPQLPTPSTERFQFSPPFSSRMILRRYFVFYQFFFSLNVISGSVLRFKKLTRFFFLFCFCYLLSHLPTPATFTSLIITTRLIWLWLFYRALLPSLPWTSAEWGILFVSSFSRLSLDLFFFNFFALSTQLSLPFFWLTHFDIHPFLPIPPTVLAG